MCTLLLLKSQRSKGVLLMTQIHYPSEQVEEWKTEMEEEGDPAIDVFFHEDTPQEESAEDSSWGVKLLKKRRR